MGLLAVIGPSKKLQRFLLLEFLVRSFSKIWLSSQNFKICFSISGKLYGIHFNLILLALLCRCADLLDASLYQRIGKAELRELNKNVDLLDASLYLHAREFLLRSLLAPTTDTDD